MLTPALGRRAQRARFGAGVSMAPSGPFLLNVAVKADVTSPGEARQMFRLQILIFAILTALVAPLRATEPAVSAQGADFFEKNVRPILVEACYQCHSAKAEKLKGGLFLDSRAGVLKGGKTGPAIIPGKPNESLLIKAVRYADEDTQMPPKKPLSKAQVAALETWVVMGAPDPRGEAPAVASAPLTVLSLADSKNFWSFKRPVLPATPAVTGDWAKSPIDAFILSKLNEAGLSPAPIADKRTLIRRATFDLTGLPPTAEEVAAFEADTSASAFEKVLDRLLASPTYGQRWARHWLDVARYADTKGYVFQEERRYPFAYTYRDWVVNALNDDLPYDQFLTYQIAADRVEVSESTGAKIGTGTISSSSLNPEPRPLNPHLAAMGFLTLGRRFLNSQPDIIDDRIDTLTRGTMGLTVACARCHDHKFDPIPTADYYSLYGVFASSVEPMGPDLPLLASDHSPQGVEYEKELAARESAIATMRQSLWEKLVGPLKTPASIEAYLTAVYKARGASDMAVSKIVDDAKLNKAVFRRWNTYLNQSAGGVQILAPWRTLKAVNDPAAAETIKKLAASLAEISNLKSEIANGSTFPTNIPLAQVETIFNRDDKNKLDELKKKRDALMATHPGAPARAMVLTDAVTPVNPVIFKRGNAAMPGAPVPRQFLAAVAGETRQPFKDGSGRLELARAIASRDNPFTARVFVNRVWLQHFGAGLVRTPSDFGVRGERPTHPELLDYLAINFMDSGWSIKKLHKTIMLSAAWQQGSLASDKARQIDSENRLLSHQNRQRLDFEALRDSLLFAGGQLDLAIGGKPVDLLTQPFTRRRTLYGFVDRQNLPGMFRDFDFASPDQHAPMRFANTVPQQALFMMNSPFAVEQARALAGRTANMNRPADRVRAMYRAALARDPWADEIKLALAYIDAEASPAPIAASAVSPWKYGYGKFDELEGRVTQFTPLPHFTGTAWQGGPKVPDRKLNFCLLNAEGGHAGLDQSHAAVRRWIAPRDGAISITGTLAHHSAQGDGVRGRIVSSRSGELAALIVHNKTTQTQVDTVEVKAGDTLDFVVDCIKENSFDSFTWPIVLKMKTTPDNTAGGDDTQEWNSQADFAGPEVKVATTPLTAWEKLAQVLLQTNEFAFVD